MNTMVSTRVIVWFVSSAVWVLLCTAAMSVNMPEPQLVHALMQTAEPTRIAAGRMWLEYEALEQDHLVRWTLLGFLPPLLALLVGILRTRTAAARAKIQTR